MNAFRLPFVGFVARISVGLTALSTLHSAMATDEYVVYGMLLISTDELMTPGGRLTRCDRGRRPGGVSRCAAL